MTPPRPLRVLIADDNADSAESLALLLQMYGHEVRTAHTGTEAVELGRAFAPQVALLDIGLPGLDGYEVARRMRALAGEKVVLVAVTGWDQDEHRKRARLAGFDHHVAKPADPGRIKVLLDQLRGGLE
jgi:CheY-like chemotaxis protein